MNTDPARLVNRQANAWVLAVVLAFLFIANPVAPRVFAQSSADTAESTSSQPGTTSGSPPKPVAQKRVSQKPVGPKPQDKGVIVKVKEWVQEKWREFRGESVASPATVQSRAEQAAFKEGGASGIGTDSASPEAKPAPVESDSKTGVVSNIPQSETGVPVYTIADVDVIPRLEIGKELKVTADRYSLGADAAKFFDRMVAHQKESPTLLSAKQIGDLKKTSKGPGPIAKIKTVFFKPKGKVSRESFDKIMLVRSPENKFDLQKYVALTPEELRFLSGLLLFQRGDKCPVAIGLFHALSKSKKYAAEGNYYLAMCSKMLGLTTDFVDRARRVLETGDVHYSKKILPEVSPDVPYELIEPFGKALQGISGNNKIMTFEKPEVAGNIYYILANYGAQSNNFKLAAKYGQLVPDAHPKWAQAQFLLALGEYQTGSKANALKRQEELVRKLDADKTKAEFQALVALNLARMYFQEKNFAQSREWFLKVYKDHPLWLQSLQEMGWSQLQSGDFEGAIGNMYSVQSPYFTSVYKPESYVVRTIGYLNLCQYGDAYRTLTTLEKTYRPWLQKMLEYQTTRPDYMATVRKFLAEKSSSAEIDGLPSQVIREMVRHKDYLNLQTSLNRQIDERSEYEKLDGEVAKALGRARWMVNNSRKRADSLRAKISSIKKNPQLEENRLAWKSELDNELNLLNGYFFEVDLFNEAKASLQIYRAEVVAGADSRIEKMKARIVSVLDGRLKRMREDLARVIENNELLRYEVFAGSGENIRFQVAGGEKGNRVPADVIPKSKSLQWDFDGEYWEDEIGHYRSSLKNNCPDTKTAGM